LTLKAMTLNDLEH